MPHHIREGDQCRPGSCFKFDSGGPRIQRSDRKACQKRHLHEDWRSPKGWVSSSGVHEASTSQYLGHTKGNFVYRLLNDNCAGSNGPTSFNR